MTATDTPELSVVVPVFNERDNVGPLVAEIVAALRGRIPFEIVYVDDCSKDDSFAMLQQLMQTTPELRVLGHLTQSGQSTAIRSGVGSTIASMWSVDDRATAKLMKKFYQTLTQQNRVSKAEALRVAQREIRKEYEHPYYWASFVLVGNWL